MGKNINSLQLLRNAALFDDKAAAISGITGYATNDGTVKLARYKEEEVTSGGTKVEVIKTIFGICYNPSGNSSSTSGFSYTIYDSPQEVIAELTKRLDTLQGNGDKEGSVANSIKTAINALNAGSFGGTNKVITTISESGGVISATAIDLAAIAVSATVIASDVNTIALTGETVAAQIAELATRIGSLDYADTDATEGSYVSKVTETDGQITVTHTELPTVNKITSSGQAIVAVSEDKGKISAETGDIAAEHVTIADASNYFTATTVEAALEELYSQAGAGSKVTLSATSGTGNVLKVYTIMQGSTEVGTIDIPKDLVVTSGSVVKGTWDGNNFTESEAGTGTALKLVIANQTAPVYINTLDLVKDHVGVSGITISDTNEISVKIDTTSESFLSVSADGVKLSGVQAAINKATTEVVKDNEGHVTVTKTPGTSGQSIYTIGEKDIASAALLGTTGDTKDKDTAFGKIAQEVADRVAAIQEQKNALDTEIAARKAVDGQSGNEYVANSKATYISGATSLNDADVNLDTAIKTEAAARKAEDDKIVSGLGFSTDDTNYLIPGDGKSLSESSYTVKSAIYTLDDAITAAKLKAVDNTVVVTSGDTGTTVKVNIESATNDGHKIVTFDGDKFIYSDAILDAGTY